MAFSITIWIAAVPSGNSDQAGPSTISMRWARSSAALWPRDTLAWSEFGQIAQQRPPPRRFMNGRQALQQSQQLPPLIT